MGDLLFEDRSSLHHQARTATEPLIRGFGQIPELLSWEQEAVFRLRLWIERTQTRSRADTVQLGRFSQVKKSGQSRSQSRSNCRATVSLGTAALKTAYTLAPNLRQAA
jgi:hypothetical protein